PELVLLLGEPETLSYDELQRAFGQLIHGEAWETREIPKALAKAGAWFQDVLPGPTPRTSGGVGTLEPFIKPWMIDLADDHYALDFRRAGSVMGGEPRHSLRGTLPGMVDVLNADPLGWYRENKLEPPAWLEATAAPAAKEEARPREHHGHASHVEEPEH